MLVLLTCAVTGVAAVGWAPAPGAVQAASTSVPRRHLGPLLRAEEVPRRAVLSGAAALLASGASPAVAKSKKKAEEEATQKATSRAAREAMKEYKFAPRPELIEVDGKYQYKEGTVKEGSIGELSGYFNEKGAQIQANYAKDLAKSTGKTSAEAERIAQEKLAKINEKRGEKKKKAETADEKKVREFCINNPNACKPCSAGKNAAVGC